MNKLNPWSELQKIKRRSNISLKPVTEIVRTANNHGSPNRPATEIIEMISLINLVLDKVSLLRCAVLRVSVESLTTIQIYIVELKIITTRSGPRNAPQKAPGWEIKQLNIKNNHNRGIHALILNSQWNIPSCVCVPLNDNIAIDIKTIGQIHNERNNNQKTWYT